MEDLAKTQCVPCRKGDPPLDQGSIDEYLRALPDWKLVEGKEVPRIRRRFRFPNFAAALAFTNQIGAVAEEQDHHPRIVTEWGSVTVDWWTHAISGNRYFSNDFVSCILDGESYETRCTTSRGPLREGPGDRESA
ncbi:MAG: 4a-hydroxytetrahydrobiopterin dehydratase [Spirochaetes bacterium]|nr:4a-hydroxytetrahydrobiopterin dehydratase [Spirochaetota bacterium]